MRENPDWDSMPVNPDVRRYIRAVRDYQLEERRTMVRFAPMLCQCQHWYDWRFPVAPQAECMIHTTVAFDQNGEWMLRDPLGFPSRGSARSSRRTRRGGRSRG